MKLFLKLLTWFVAFLVAVIFFLGGWYLRGAWGIPDEGTSRQPGAVVKAEVWTCPMHPEIKRPEPGKCPKCGMDLVLKKEDKSGGARRLEMSDEARKLAQIVTARVERRVVTHEVRMVGKLDYDETRVRTISAWVPGRLDRLYVDYTGISVAKGDHLVLIYSPDMLTAQEELIEARKQVAAGRDQPNEYLRKSALRALESAREKLRLWGLTAEQVAEIEKRGKAEDHVLITSPTAGVVIHKGLNQGDYVKTGTPIYRIADLSHLWIRLDAYESDLPWIRYGQEVSIETEAYPGEHFRGRISFIDPYLNDKTRTVKVRVIVENKDARLKPGMFVRTAVQARLGEGGKVMDPRLAGKWICPMHPEVIEDAAGKCRVCGMPLAKAEDLGYSTPTAKPQLSIVVPASAVLATGKRGVVYVEVPGKKKPTYEGREVVLGPRAGDDYVILAGLTEGERIVVHGNFKIDSALQIHAKKSMMSMPEDPTPLQGKDMMLFRGQLDSVYRPYFDAQRALAKDEAAKAREALAALTKAAASLRPLEVSPRAHEEWHKIAPDLHAAATAGKDAARLPELREAFRDLSQAMIKLDKVFGHSGEEVHYEMFCPMAFDNAGAGWLQEGSTVHNPYLGSSMPHCGEVRTYFPGRGGETAPEVKTQTGPTPTPKPTTKPKPKPKPTTRPTPKTVSLLPLLEPVYGGYLAAQDALAGDSHDEAKVAFRDLESALGKIDDKLVPQADRQYWTGLRARLAKATKAGAGSSDIKAAREAFRDASEAIIALETRFGHQGSATYYQMFCPMAFGEGAAWLQTSDKVRNPYYGASMLKCGSLKKRHPGKGGR